MHQVTPEAARASLTASPTRTGSTTSANAPPAVEAPANWLRRLWERMAATFGHAWTSTHGLSPQDAAGALTVHGDTWAKALAGLDGQQFGIGLAACIAEGGEFPPSAPRFRAMCLGIPTLARVKLELLSHDDDRTPFTRFVWGLIDGHRYRQATADVADRMLRDAYDLASEERMRGAPLPERPVAAIVDDSKRKPVPATPERAQAAIDECLNLLGTSAPRVEPLSDEARALQQQLEGRQS